MAIILANRDEAGRFKTWLRPEGVLNDTDSVVNANVLLYLGVREETMQTADFLIETIERGTENESMHYYLDPLELHYGVSRAYHHGVVEFGQCKETILNQTVARLDGEVMNPLLLALALCTLINYGVEPMENHAKSVLRLLDEQANDGSWPRAAFFSGPGPPWEPQAWWGSKEMTTTFCLEAIARILVQTQAPPTREKHAAQPTGTSS
jgi:hypothetical protein